VVLNRKCGPGRLAPGARSMQALLHLCVGAGVGVCVCVCVGVSDMPCPCLHAREVQRIQVLVVLKLS